MKKLLFLAFMIFAASASAQIRADDDYHVVFDLDWTLINPREGAVQKPDFIESGAEYRLMPLAAESLLRLHQRGFKISIFSGSPKARVEKITHIIFEKMRELARANGLDDKTIVPFAILNETDMKLNPTGRPTDRFRDRFFKILPQYFPKARVIMVDDIPEFASPEQRSLFLILESTYNNFDSYDDVISARESARAKDVVYVPPTAVAWAADRGRIPWAAELIIQAKTLSVAHEIPLSAAVAQLNHGARTSAAQMGYLFHGSLMANQLTLRLKSASGCRDLLSPDL